MEILTDPEELILCPYDKAHHIRRSKMNGHIVKCKKNFTHLKIVACDFNTTHQIPEPELQYHLEHCPDRKTFEEKVYEEEGQNLDKYPIQMKVVETEDCWDDEVKVPSYNPRVYCEQNEILRHVDVESAATRKNFRMQERRRFNNINCAPQPIKRPKDVALPMPARFVAASSSCDQPRAQPTAQALPEPVSNLMERIKVGAKKPFLPHQ